jgi:hypothetical protein
MSTQSERSFKARPKIEAAEIVGRAFTAAKLIAQRESANGLTIAKQLCAPSAE